MGQSMDLDVSLPWPCHTPPQPCHIESITKFRGSVSTAATCREVTALQDREAVIRQRGAGLLMLALELHAWASLGGGLNCVGLGFLPHGGVGDGVV